MRNIWDKDSKKRKLKLRHHRHHNRPAHMIVFLILFLLLALCSYYRGPLYAWMNNTTTSFSSNPSFHIPKSVQYRLPSDSRIHVLEIYPHDAHAFTQGLLVESPGILIESTGLYGRSSVRRVNATTGKAILHTQPYPEHEFGEGITYNMVNHTYIALTWRSQTIYVLDALDLHVIRKEHFGSTRNQGWGITTIHETSEIVMSDGSHILHFWDPVTLKETKRLPVVMSTTTGKFNGVGGSSHNKETTTVVSNVPNLNELEYARGFIFANIWYSHSIIQIDVHSGQVVQSYDVSSLCANHQDNKNGRADDAVLNGIAYDKVHDIFYITGKLWDTMYLVRLLSKLA